MLIVRVENIVERRFEPVCDLMFMRGEGEVGRDYSKDRGHDIIGNRPIWLDRADNFDEFWVQHDLFMRLAECRGYRILAGIDSSARKRDLACMGAQMLAPNSENKAGPGPIGERNEDRCRYVGSCRYIQMIAFERGLRSWSRRRTTTWW